MTRKTQRKSIFKYLHFKLIVSVEKNLVTVRIAHWYQIAVTKITQTTSLIEKQWYREEFLDNPYQF